MSDTDIIDQLAGIAEGSRLDTIRRARPQTRDNIQASYDALFSVAAATSFTLAERMAVAYFSAALHRSQPEAAFYKAEFSKAGPDDRLIEAIDQTIAANLAEGPKGAYPAGPLSKEDTPPPAWNLSVEAAAILGSRLGSAFSHAHMLVYHPRDASREALDALLASGWSTSEIVTLSQIAGFLSFQLRVVAGLRLLAMSADGRSAA